jgi:hypothetical protein
LLLDLLGNKYQLLSTKVEDMLVHICTRVVVKYLLLRVWLSSSVTSIGLVVIITTRVAEGRRFESRGVLLLYSVSSLVL